MARESSLANRHDHILHAALMCFLENGYHQTGVRDIARRANVSLGNLYNHFESKHAVLAEIAQLEREELSPFVALLSQNRDAGTVLKEFIHTYGLYLLRKENVVLGIEITSEAIRKPDIARMFLENRSELLTALSELLERGSAHSVFHLNAPPLETANLIHDVLEGNALRNCLSPTGSELNAVWGFVSAALRFPT